MELYFFRHGIAADKTDAAFPNDRDRSLTEEGVRKTQEAAEGLKRLQSSFDKILTSPWLRARQTAQILADCLEMNHDLEDLPELEGDRSVDELLHALGDRRASRILLVGHQPLMGQTITRLLCSHGDFDLDLKKSGVAVVAVDSLPLRKPGTLLWLLTPKQLRMIGR